MHRMVRKDLIVRHLKIIPMTFLFILAILAFVYLAYVLVRPEKF
jgi:hypothetical protein